MLLLRRRRGKKTLKLSSRWTTFEHQSSVYWVMSTRAKQRFSIRYLQYTLILRPWERWHSIVMSTSVCVSVCLSTSISPEPRVQSLPNVLRMLPMAVAWSSSGRVTKSRWVGAILEVFPMTVHCTA